MSVLEILYYFDFSVPIGGGVPQQHYEHTPRGSDKAMRLVRSSMQANLRLYRRTLNAQQNIYYCLITRGVIQYDQKKRKLYNIYSQLRRTYQ